MRVVFDDGGRAVAGFEPSTTDCATRAIAIATGLPYGQVHADLSKAAGEWTREHWPALAGRTLADVGIPPHIAGRYLRSRGWHGILNRLGRPGDEWHARVHDLLPGRYVLEFRTATTGHLVAFVDGELRDGPVEVERDFLREPLFGWWTEHPVMPRRPRADWRRPQWETPKAR